MTPVSCTLRTHLLATTSEIGDFEPAWWQHSMARRHLRGVESSREARLVL